MSNPVLRVGDPLPEFQVTLDDGSTLRSEELRGVRTVLYFYPKDNTPGCTAEACDFRDHLPDLTDRLGVRVIGVSPDSVASHLRFKAKHGLSFPLISDEGHRLAEAFGVWREKTVRGKTSFGVVRSTFVIRPDGIIERIVDPVSVKGHVEALVSALST